MKCPECSGELTTDTHDEHGEDVLCVDCDREYYILYGDEKYSDTIFEKGKQS